MDSLDPREVEAARPYLVGQSAAQSSPHGCPGHGSRLPRTPGDCFLPLLRPVPAFTRTETVGGVSRQVTNDKRALEFFLTERRSALTFIARDRSFTELCDLKTLPRIMQHMNDTFALGSFADLGLIDASGKQLCYTGPYDLKGRDYHDQEWFYRVGQRGAFVSEVFLGYRHSPHFAIATRQERGSGYYILRATINAEVLAEQIVTAGLTPDDDVFLVNQEGC